MFEPPARWLAWPLPMIESDYYIVKNASTLRISSWIVFVAHALLIREFRNSWYLPHIAAGARLQGRGGYTRTLCKHFKISLSPLSIVKSLLKILLIIFPFVGLGSPHKVLRLLSRFYNDRDHCGSPTTDQPQSRTVACIEMRECPQLIWSTGP